MFIVLRKKVVKRYLALALSMIFIGRIVSSVPNAQASVTDFPITITADELKVEGFSTNELKSMGFVNGLGKIIVYNAKQKQIWNQRVEKARERADVAKRSGKKISPRDAYLLERDNEIKNPPKDKLVKKLFGDFGQQGYLWIKGYFKGSSATPPDAKIIGEGLTVGGFLLLFKALAPLVPLAL